MRFLLPCSVLMLSAAAASERPNILWITSEDNGAHWLGCYGNAQATTPRLDRLAEEGYLFRHAYSNAPVCAVARSTIFTGVHAPSQGTQHMRSRHAIPEYILPYVVHLKKAGYYCTNASKTDYNFKGNDRAWWDECSEQAHYRNRSEGQPFFAVFNLTVTHESALFPAKRGKGPTRLSPDEVVVPPHLPDLPEVRGDIAVYHDKMSQLDTRVGRLLDQLEQADLAENTIVFYYSDHGGPLPRSKRYLKDTGVRVPLIIRVPEKWRPLSPFGPGQVVEEPVAFVDFAATALSLAGIEPPDYMQGRAFLGNHRAEPEDGVLLYADRFDETYGMRRGWTDGRWKYIRRFTPHLPAAPYSSYQFSMPSWIAWRQAWQDGKLDDAHRRIWEAPQPVEELFDIDADPWEINNLAGDPRHTARLAAMRARLKGKMAEVKDTGIVPEPMFAKLVSGRPIAEFVRAPGFDHAAILNLAFAATSGDAADIDVLNQAVRSEDPAKRYWGLAGLLIRGGTVEMKPLLDDAHPINRVLAAEVMLAAGESEVAAKALIAELDRDLDASSMLYLLNVLNRLDLGSSVPDTWIDKALQNPKTDEYVNRFARQLNDARK